MMEKHTQTQATVSDLSRPSHGTTAGRTCQIAKVSLTIWIIRISCSTLLAAILFVCAWLTIARPLAVRKGGLHYDESLASKSWVVPSILIVATFLSIVIRSQLE